MVALVCPGGTSGQTFSPDRSALAEERPGSRNSARPPRRPGRDDRWSEASMPNARATSAKSGLSLRSNFAKFSVEEQFLPLPDHAERLVVEQHDLQRQAIAAQRRQLLDVHHDRAVAGNVMTVASGRPAARRSPRAGHSPSCRGRRWSGAPAGGEAAMLGDPHLVLADVAGDDQIAVRARSASALSSAGA